MATRAIITHQPEVSCDMCGRRLLRGERPDVFLAAGSRRTVCELCVPRAAGEGWTRVSEMQQEMGPHGERSGRGRSLLSRLRQRRALEGDGVERDDAPGEQWQPGAGDSWREAPAEGWRSRERRQRHRRRRAPGDEVVPAKAFEVDEQRSFEASRLDEEMDGGEVAFEDDRWVDSGFALDHSPVDYEQLEEEEGEQPALPAEERPLSVDLALEQAIEIFNASECAGRVAGIARALGQPTVTLSPHPNDHDRTIIVVAWELCWYRYEVDLRERPATIALLGEGTELDELPDEDRLGNATADERGELTLVR